ncbi:MULTISPECIES: LamG-like jellyroll fold domain-containing protein [Niastella]|uniref:IPT/TIG domain-containing protein n=1 Tax=Niastella soli TaxID=2821487 RepID=A0ABS3YRL8_9BACT|nr:LamG-like jellyroll fold domain-containing protein [Niastella soli]MBO9200542.1 IPT/TIG domain-containing protein [Niastella soli]
MKFALKNIQFLSAILVLAAVYAGCQKGPNIKTYTYPTAEPKGLFPDSGYAGFAEVVINGEQFGDYKNAVKVFFNGIQADTVLSCEDGKIVVRVPDDAISGKVSLQVWTNTIDSVGDFRVVPFPIVKAANKDIGLPGETVEITGTGFGSDLTKVKVAFNGTPATVTDITDTLLNVTLPQGFSSGSIVVYVNDYPVTGPLFRAVATLPNPVYWLSFENNLTDKMGGAAATYTYVTGDGTAKPIRYVAGKNGLAVSLSGTGNRKASNNQFIACQPQVSKYKEVSVTAWVNWGSLDYPDSAWYQEPVFDFGQARGLRMALMTRMQANKGPNMVGRLIFEKIDSFPSNTPFDATCNTALKRFEWHHVAMTISTANHLLIVYLDGSEIGRVVLANAADPTLFNHNKVYIGAPTNGVANEPAYGGLIDEFEIFNQALSPDQVFADFYKNKP